MVTMFPLLGLSGPVEKGVREVSKRHRRMAILYVEIDVKIGTRICGLRVCTRLNKYLNFYKIS